MTDAACSWLFEGSCLVGRQLQDAVLEQQPGGACETVKCTAYSSGPVSDDEVLTRLIIHPIHFDVKTGIISPMAFQDACTIDLSVFREAQAQDNELQLSIDEIRATGESRVQPQDRVVDIIMQAVAGAIRGLTFEDDASRMCFVYDTATAEKPSHASVFTTARAKTRSGQKAVRRAMLELFAQRQKAPKDYRPLNYAGHAS